MAQLTEVCANIKNYFLRGDDDRKTGTFNIVSGTAPLDSLLSGQYFAIFGSILNDGVWQNTAADLANLRNETFTGQIWSMSVPRDFEQLCEDITAWRTKNEDLDSANMSVFQSENVSGVYSYTKGNNSSSSGGNSSVATWQSVFSSRLSTYRRISL